MGLYSGGIIYGPIFALRFWWAYIRGGAYIRSFTVFENMKKINEKKSSIISIVPMHIAYNLHYSDSRNSFLSSRQVLEILY